MEFLQQCESSSSDSDLNCELQAQRSASVLHWCCSRENHKHSGVHYHFAIKLDRNQRWLPSKKFLKEAYGISVHFSSVHKNYYTAWCYVTKEDAHYEESEGHPDLTNGAEPSTMKAHEAIALKSQKRKYAESTQCVSTDTSPGPSNAHDNKRSGKRKRLSSYDVSQIIVAKKIVAKKIVDRTALMAFAVDGFCR